MVLLELLHTDVYMKSRLPDVFPHPDLLASVRYRRCTYMRLQTLSGVAPAYPVYKRRLVTSLGPEATRAFLQLLAPISSNQGCVAQLLHLRLHLPSSPTMSLRSEDAETTKNCQVSLMFRPIAVKTLRRLVAAANVANVAKCSPCRLKRAETRQLES